MGRWPEANQEVICLIRLRSVFPDFLSFWETAQGKSLEEQLQLWEELYEAKHPKVFRVYFSAPYWGRREELPKALRRYSEDIKKINKAAKKAEELIPQITERALAAFAVGKDEVEIDVIAFVGTYGADGFGFPIAGRPTIFLALERLAEYEPNRMKALIAHELSHGIHIELGRKAHPGLFAGIVKDPLQFLKLAPGLFLEGLAVAASKRIVPDLEERTYLFYSPEQWEWCRANRAKLIELVLKDLDSQDQEAYYKFFTTWEPTKELPYHRTGYYLGYLVIEQLLKRHSLRELAELKPQKYSGLIREVGSHPLECS